MACIDWDNPFGDFCKWLDETAEDIISDPIGAIIGIDEVGGDDKDEIEKEAKEYADSLYDKETNAGKWEETYQAKLRELINKRRFSGGEGGVLGLVFGTVGLVADVVGLKDELIDSKIDNIGFNQSERHIAESKMLLDSINQRIIDAYKKDILRLKMEEYFSPENELDLKFNEYLAGNVKYTSIYAGEMLFNPLGTMNQRKGFMIYDVYNTVNGNEYIKVYSGSYGKVPLDIRGKLADTDDFDVMKWS